MQCRVVVVQRRQRNIQKKRDARAELLFCSSKPIKRIASLSFPLSSTSSLLKLPTGTQTVRERYSVTKGFFSGEPFQMT